MPISVMLKPSSSLCNLKCKYCFYSSLASERDEYSKGYMNKETAENVVTKALLFAKGTDVFFTFQGGEPLLSGMDFFKDFVKFVNQKNEFNSKITFCLQTNGTLINDEWCKFFFDNNFLIGISLDGDENLNSYRLYPDGKSSFNDVINGINLLKKYEVKFNVLSVLTKELAVNIRTHYRFMKELGIEYFQYINCLRPLKSDYDESFYMSSEDYGDALKKVFKLYYNDNMRGKLVSIRSFDNYLLRLRGQNAEQCGMNGVCSTQFVVEGDGTVYPCDFYCNDEWELGNINESSFDDLYHSKKCVDFLKESFILDEECKTCKYFSLCCGGGCKRYRADKNYCSAYKELFDSSLFMMQNLAK